LMLLGLGDLPWTRVADSGGLRPLQGDVTI
jgi:hypothetical protein